MAVIIRQAIEKDVNKIFQLARQTSDFMVSEQIRFYEYDEVLDWVRDPRDNILLVAIDAHSHLAGFLFCKIMSIHWAFLDNFYVAPIYRGSKVAKKLITHLKVILKESNIKYLSILVKINRSEIVELCKKVGFSQQGTYIWLDTFIEL